MKDSHTTFDPTYTGLSSIVRPQPSSEIRILHGQYVGGTSSSKGRLKKLQLKRNEDEVTIKLPKPIGQTLTGKLQPGMMIQVWVRPKKDDLKALMVMPSTMPNETLPSAEEGCNLALQTPAIKVEKPIDPEASQSPACTLKVCTKGKCYKQGGRQVMQALESAIQEHNLEGAIAIEPTGCLKNCKKGPTVKAYPDATKYSFVGPQDVTQILQRYAKEQEAS